MHWDFKVSRASRHGPKEFQLKVGRAVSVKRAWSLGSSRWHWEDSKRR